MEVLIYEEKKREFTSKLIPYITEGSSEISQILSNIWETVDITNIDVKRNECMDIMRAESNRIKWEFDLQCFKVTGYLFISGSLLGGSLYLINRISPDFYKTHKKSIENIEGIAVGLLILSVSLLFSIGH